MRKSRKYWDKKFKKRQKIVEFSLYYFIFNVVFISYFCYLKVICFLQNSLNIKPKVLKISQQFPEYDIVDNDSINLKAAA